MSEQVYYPNAIQIDSQDTNAIIKALSNHLCEIVRRNYLNFLRCDILVFSGHEDFNDKPALYENTPYQTTIVFREKRIAAYQVAGLVRTIRQHTIDDDGNYTEINTEMCYSEYRDGYLPRLVIKDEKLAMVVQMKDSKS